MVLFCINITLAWCYYCGIPLCFRTNVKRMFDFLPPSLKLNTKLWGIYDVSLPATTCKWFFVYCLTKSQTWDMRLIPLMSIISYTVYHHQFTQSLSPWELNQFVLLPDPFPYDLLFLRCIQGANKVSWAGGALCLIAYQCTMLSAETSLNKQWREKQTVREKQWNNTSGKSSSLMNWENDEYWVKS